MPKLLTFLAALLLPLAAIGQTNSLPEKIGDVEQVRNLLANRSKPVTWVFTGDSITQGAKHTHGSRGYVEHFAERVRFEMGRSNDAVINTAISGDVVGGILRGFERRVARFKPEVVSIMIGMNDSKGGPEKREEFRKNLSELIQRVRALGAVPLLHTVNIVQPESAVERGDVPAYMAIVSEVASGEKVMLVDHWKHWESLRETSLKEWMNDPIHPNGRGHREMAILVFNTLGIYDPKSPTCQPIAP